MRIMGRGRHNLEVWEVWERERPADRNERMNERTNTHRSHLVWVPPQLELLDPLPLLLLVARRRLLHRLLHCDLDAGQAEHI
jgi:hypothetical protein